MTADETKRKKDDERRELAAVMLAEAVFDSDEAVAKRHGQSVRTVERYRAQAAVDPLLKGAVDAKLRALEKAWASEARLTLFEGLRAQRKMVRNILNDPDWKASPGAYKEIQQGNLTVAEILFTLESSVYGAGNTESTGGEERSQANREGEPRDAAERVN